MLSPKQERFVAEYLRGGSVRAVCKRAKCSPRTYRNWAKAPEFRAAVEAAQDAVRSEARGELKAMTAAAVRGLWKLLRSRNESVRLKAILGCLDREMKVSELVELAKEVEELRQLVEAQRR